MQDMLDAMLRGEIEPPPVAKLIGFKLIECRNGIARFELEDDLEVPSPDSSPNELIAVTIGFVTAYFKVREKTFDRFVKSHMVRSEFVALKVVLKVSWREAVPIYHRWR